MKNNLVLASILSSMALLNNPQASFAQEATPTNLENQMRQQILAEYQRRNSASTPDDSVAFLSTFDMLGHQSAPAAVPVAAQPVMAPSQIDTNLLLPSTMAQQSNPVDLLQPSTAVINKSPAITQAATIPNQQWVTTSPAVPSGQNSLPTSNSSDTNTMLPPALADLLNSSSGSALQNDYLPPQAPKISPAKNHIAAEHYLYASISQPQEPLPQRASNPAIPPIQYSEKPQQIAVEKAPISNIPAQYITADYSAKSIPVAILEAMTIGDAEQAVIEQVTALQKNYGGKLILQGNPAYALPLQITAAAFNRQGAKNVIIDNTGSQEKIKVLLDFTG